MKFGLFYQLPCADWQSQYQRYQDTLEQIELADELGFENAWFAELHFNAGLSSTPSPLMLAAAAAHRTKNIRLGVAVNLLPLHHPVRLAEDVATLDIISNGRAEFGVGRGSIPTHFQGFGVPLEESRERFLEGLDFVLKAWTNEELSFQGKFYSADGLRLIPKPIQKPHPPIRIASNSDDTFDLVGQLGHSMFATPVIVPMPRLREGVKRYRAELESGGHPVYGDELALAIPTHVSEDGRQAVSTPEASAMNYMGNLRANALASQSQQSSSPTIRPRETQSRFLDMTYDRWCEEIANYGDPGRCIEGIHAIQEEFRMGEYICWFETGGLIPNDVVKASMRLFAEKVMPHFR